MFDPAKSQSEHGDGGNKGESNEKHMVHAQTGKTTVFDALSPTGGAKGNEAASR